MNEDPSDIRGRSGEVKEIHQFISSRIKSRKSGILYLTGPPGTGKSMCISYVLNQIKDITQLNLNCLRAQTSKAILTRICCSVGLEKYVKFNESEMIARLTKKFSGRTSLPHLIVLDEMDQLPKSKNADLIKTIFSWPNLANSKLILVGIANTVNLTSRYQTISSFIGKDNHHLTKIIFRPYSSKDIKSILEWYLENDENFEDAAMDPKAIEMIAMKFSRENGDIRGALNALKSVIDDTVKQENSKRIQTSQFPTPPSTPPLTPCKERTRVASVANSIKKRQKTTHHKEDKLPVSHEIILCCLSRLCSKTRDSSVDLKVCKELATHLLLKYGLTSSLDDFRSMLDNLELQGLISIKKGKLKDKIILRVSENEIISLVPNKDYLMDLIEDKIKQINA